VTAGDEDAVGMVTESPGSLLPGTTCAGDEDSVLNGGTRVTDGRSVSESLLTSQTLIGSVQLTSVI